MEMPPFLLFSVGGLSPCFVSGLSHDSPFTSSRRRRVVAHRRWLARALLCIARDAGGGLGLEVFARGILPPILHDALVVADAALLAQSGVPGRSARFVGEGADTADVVVRGVVDVDDLGLIQLVGDLVSILPRDHGHDLASENVGDPIVPVDGVTVRRDVLRRVDVTEVSVPLRDHGERPVGGGVLVPIDGLPGLALVDAEAADEDAIAAERRAHEMGLKPEAADDLAGAPAH